MIDRSTNSLIYSLGNSLRQTICLDVCWKKRVSSVRNGSISKPPGREVCTSTVYRLTPSPIRDVGESLDLTVQVVK